MTPPNSANGGKAPHAVTAPLFVAGPLRCHELGAGDLAELQRFFDANPLYFHTVNGQPPARDEASQEFHTDPPPDFSFTRRWLLGFMNESGSMIGMANLSSDLPAADVWHVGLFIIATARLGSGDAPALYRGLESWIAGQGARWLRLNVVEGNARAQRFWQRCGFVEVRKRHGIEMGARVNTLSVMVKPLSGGTMAEYRALVARDRPES